MTAGGCRICESPIKAKIEKKDRAWNADRTIKWARENGVRINRTILARHRADHIENAHSSSKPDIPVPDAPDRNGREIKPKPGATPPSVDDLEFLDAVRDRAFEKLLAGEFELKLDSAFKAIELKYKISDESGSEKLLLEILSEIRADELARGRRRSQSSENR